MTRLVALFALVWLALATLPGWAAARAPAAMLPRGAGVVIVAPARPTAEDMESEAYGDWAEYLNAFASKRPARLPLVRMTAARWRQVARQPALADTYATVFMRANGAVLFHDGMVLEPQVYAAGAAWTMGGGKADLAAYGFTEARLVRRR